VTQGGADAGVTIRLEATDALADCRVATRAGCRGGLAIRRPLLTAWARVDCILARSVLRARRHEAMRFLGSSLGTPRLAARRRACRWLALRCIRWTALPRFDAAATLSGSDVPR
jgi:hypothetical protein